MGYGPRYGKTFFNLVTNVQDVERVHLAKWHDPHAFYMAENEQWLVRAFYHHQHVRPSLPSRPFPYQSLQPAEASLPVKC